MKKAIGAALTFLAVSVYGQIDRAGNVIDDGSGGGGFNGGGAVFLFAGGMIGLAVTMFKPNLSTKFCVITGAIIGAAFPYIFRAFR